MAYKTEWGYSIIFPIDSKEEMKIKRLTDKSFCIDGDIFMTQLVEALPEGSFCKCD